MIDPSTYFFSQASLVFLSIAAVISSLYFFIKLKSCRKELKSKESELIEKEKILLLASLSAGILHKISQPITAIYGFVRFMKKEIKPEDPFYTPVSLLEEQSQDLKKMLEDLLELLQNQPPVKENVSVNEIIEKSMRFVTDELRIRRIEFDVQLKENLPLVYADGLKLRHLFINLIVKAMERLSALRPGQRKSLQIASFWDETTRELGISFKDSGTEITDEERGPIFKLISEFNGILSLENDGQGGARFVVRMPCANRLKNINIAAGE